MSEPIAYAYTNTGVYASHDGINFAITANSHANVSAFGNCIIVSSNLIIFGNSTVFNTLNSTAWTGTANVVANTSNLVISVFTRTGNVVSQANDYTFAQIGVKPTTVSGYGITDALVTTNNLSDVANVVLSRANLKVGVHGADIASASTINLQTATGDVVDVTGTTTITAITLNEGEERTVRFANTIVLTNNNTSLILPGTSNITTAVGDYAVFRGYASSVVRCSLYQRLSLVPFDGAIWNSSTPTPVFSGGSGTVAMRWKQVGKIVTINFRLSCTATGNFSTVASPTGVVVSSQNYTIFGREIARTGIIWFLQVNSVGNFSGGTYNNGLPAMTTGDIIDFSGVYEAV